MTTVRYARYVLVNEEKTQISWHEKEASAIKYQKAAGGKIFDTGTEDPENIETILHHIRKNMGGVE